MIENEMTTRRQMVAQSVNGQPCVVHRQSEILAIIR